MQSDLPPVARLLMAGTAGGCAEVSTIPVETAKVRLQLQKSGAKYTNPFQTMSLIAKEEGVAQLWKGVVAGVHRHFGCAAFRIGLYTPIRDMCTPANHPAGTPTSFLTKCQASFIAGGTAMIFISPADVVKTRIQADARGAAGGQPRYPSPTKAYGMIFKQEGIAGLYTGLPANMTRNAVMNIFEVGCYDQYKDMLRGAGMKDGIGLHFTSAISAAFTACVFTNPLDMVKNRWITNDGTFSSIGDVVMQTMKKEGPQGFFKGFTPFFCRAGSFLVVQFCCLEQFVGIYNKYA